MMQLSEKGAASVRLHEGYVRNFYLDPVGVGTIGIGFTWASKAFRAWWAKHKPGVKFGPGAVMSREEADDALRFLFAEEYGKAVNAFLGKAGPVTLAAIARAMAEKAAAETAVVVVEKPVVADPGELETPPAQSKTVWTWLLTAIGAPIAAFGRDLAANLDEFYDQFLKQRKEAEK